MNYDYSALRQHLRGVHLFGKARIDDMGDGEALDAHHLDHHGPDTLAGAAHRHRDEIPPSTLSTMTLRQNPTGNDDPWVTPAEIAAELRISRMSAYRLLHEGDLTYTKVGRSLRVRRSELDRYLETRTHQRRK